MIPVARKVPQMAHHLTIKRGKVEMAYVGQTPWHKLGNNLEAGASVETWLNAAGMSWQIEEAVAQFSVDGAMHSADNFKVLHRSDDHAVLGIVGKDYKAVQPSEILDFYRDLTDRMGFTLETAGTLFGGKRFWGLASIGAEAAVVDAKDMMKRYLLLSSSADGSTSTEGRYTDIRVVCHNTLSAAERSGARHAISHRSVYDHDKMRDGLGIESAYTDFRQAMAQFRQMAETPCQPVDGIFAAARLFNADFDKLEAPEKIKYVEKASGPVLRIAELTTARKAIGSELDGASNTAWGWLNAVTQYIDHESRSRTDDRRLESAWFGEGNKVKERARTVAMEMVDAAGNLRTVHQVVINPELASPPASVSLDDVLAMTPALV